MEYGAWGGWESRASAPFRAPIETSPISEPVESSSDVSFAAIAPLPSNVEAIEGALQFVAGQLPQVAIVGPSGTGKSYLLRAVASVAERAMGTPMETAPVEAFLSSRRSAETAAPLVLDDAQIALGRPRMRQDLRRVLEARARRGRSTLVAFTIEPGLTGLLGMRAIHALLPNPRSWTTAQMRSPTLDERPALLAHLARTEGLRLSAALSTVLARELGGTGHTLVGAMRRMRLEGADWSTSRRTLRGLGLLDPFFSDNSAWDLRHVILREAERQRVRFARFSPVELAVYTMLREAGLCERSVAEYMGKAPAEAYGLAARFERNLAEDPQGQGFVQEFIDGVVDSLVR